MKLFRVRAPLSLEWSWVIAPDEQTAISLIAADIYTEPDDHWRAVEYPLDEAYILPASWRSEPEELEDA